jgi:hypothetical protein
MLQYIDVNQNKACKYIKTLQEKAIKCFLFKRQSIIVFFFHLPHCFTLLLTDPGMRLSWISRWNFSKQENKIDIDLLFPNIVHFLYLTFANDLKYLDLLKIKSRFGLKKDKRKTLMDSMSFMQFRGHFSV